MFCFNDTATTEIYTLSLHDALPILLIPGATRPRGWLALVFSPIFEMNMPDAFQTVPGRASASQAVWLVALAVTGVLIFASSGWRVRAEAPPPGGLGAGLALPVKTHREMAVNRVIE